MPPKSAQMNMGHQIPPARQLHVARIPESQFGALQADWSDLLRRSNADPLFMSWPWLYTWWEVWAAKLGLELVLFAAYDENRLVGLAPFFKYTRRLRGNFTVEELHFLGNAWRIAPTVRTEYIDVIVDRDIQEPAADALCERLFLENWDTLVISDRVVTPFACTLYERPPIQQLTSLNVRKDTGVTVPTSGSFETWLQTLGHNTRLKVYNRRKYLSNHHGPIQYNQEHDSSAFLEKLNHFHQQRWGKPCFDDDALFFHKRFLSRLTSDQLPCLTTLGVNDHEISALYDIQAGTRMYNLQLGFDETFDSKVSPGTLHLGFAIESAFSRETIREYDLLAGSGKHSFYKSHFRGDKVNFESDVLTRNKLLSTATRLYNLVPKALAGPLARWLGNP